MSYLDETLMKQEKIVYRTKPHYIIFMKPALWLCVTLFLFIFGPNIRGLSYLFPATVLTPALPLYAILALFALLPALSTAIAALINYQFSEYGITTKRVLVKTGFIQRVALEIYLQKIESVKVFQSFLGRIFNYGSITISGVGGSKDPFYLVPQPLAFRQQIQEQLDSTTEEIKPKRTNRNESKES